MKDTIMGILDMMALPHTDNPFERIIRAGEGRSDADALREDARRVGSDWRAAMNKQKHLQDAAKPEAAAQAH